MAKHPKNTIAVFKVFKLYFEISCILYIFHKKSIFSTLPDEPNFNKSFLKFHLKGNKNY